MPHKFMVVRLPDGKTLRFSSENVLGEWSGWELGTRPGGYWYARVVWLRSGIGIKWWPAESDDVNFGLCKIPDGVQLGPEEITDWLIARGDDLPEDLQRLANATDAGAVTRQATGHKTLLPAIDSESKLPVSLDVTRAERYDLEPGGEDFNGIEGFWNYTIHRTLFRLRDGRWFLIEERFHWEIDISLGKELKLVSDADAANLLVASGINPPEDITVYVKDQLISDEPKRESKPTRRSGMSLDEANVTAREYLEKNAHREQDHDPVSSRELAKAIGCALGTVPKLPIWKALMEQRRKRQKGKAPKAVALSEKVLASAGQDDKELQRLIREQKADSEPSPLDDSSEVVRVRKRV
jgi:hypothetical protein